MKTLLLALMLMVIAPGLKGQQTISRDSAMIEMANSDVKSFQLERSTWKRFKEHHFPGSSDYFKPTRLNSSDTSLLNDSTYVKAFRAAAYKKTLHRRTAGHKTLLIGGISLAVIAVVSLIILASDPPFGNLQ